MSEARLLTAAYRLQLHSDFGFAAAADIVPYLADLGVSHLYLSPILQAAPGSMHGYDVVDHTRVSTDLGGEAGLVALSDRAHDCGLGLVVDVVPNHMALPTPAYLNRPLWEMLRDGRDAERASWFDVDWDLCSGRIGLPVLGSPLAETLAAGELTMDVHEGQPVIRYYDQVFPVAAGTEGDAVADVLDRQHYLLAGWREKDGVLGYRRFFDVDTLVAIRVELGPVFDATHQTLVDLHRRGVIDGFRIDHPDGLADPLDYLERLRDATDGAWVVVEKILEGDEALPADWPTAGSTGYDAMKAIQASLSPPTGAELDALWRAVEGSDPDLHHTEHTAKQLVLDGLFQPELHRLVRRASAAGGDGDVSEADLAAALTALLVNVEVYRAYVRLGHPADETARGLIDAMHDKALAERPDLASALARVRSLLLDSTGDDDDVRDLVVRFQQVCGPVMAKGVEDTTFYRWHRFIALNEVGGDPLSLDRPEIEALHAWAQRQDAQHPCGLTTLSTHDTKRGEDVRAQLLAAGEDVDGWRALWSAVRQLAGDAGVDEPTAYFVMQTVVGAWPIGPERLDPYLEKAVREAKQHTTWNDPDEEYEQRVLRLGRTLVGPGPAAELLTRWLDDLAPAVRATTLAAKLLQLTLPGVPDVYQGCEAIGRFLVDPDNRRPVDFGSRQRRLAALVSGEVSGLDDEKLWVTAQALRLRRASPELYGPQGSYRPLQSDSPHVLGYLRSERVATVVTRWPGTLARTGWQQATVELPDGEWVDVLTDERHTGGRPIDCASLLGGLPVALLLREGE